MIVPLSAKAKRKVEPCPVRTRPRCGRRAARQFSCRWPDPMPVPANSSRLCSRWNMPKILSKYCGSIPSPLSCTENFHSFHRSWRRRCGPSGIPGLWYLMALPTKFWNSWTSCISSAMTDGRRSCVTSAPLSSMAPRRLRSACCNASSLEMSSRSSFLSFRPANRPADPGSTAACGSRRPPQKR